MLSEVVTSVRWNKKGKCYYYYEIHVRFSESCHNRISSLEMLDEVEELNLVLEHYAITWGVKLSSPAATVSPWNEWGLSPVQHQLD